MGFQPCVKEALMALVNSYSKAGILRPTRIETDRFDLFVPIAGGLVHCGRSRTLHGRADDAGMRPT
ncbi:hypothetical protein DS909_00085 [Phaeobacter gallaeciensis]|uniref:Uncharacterized protein n=2 Tax=Roseobacteraceae TaxID=2854170 RepID=A0A366XFQ4_9RHOB|nr:hypothetical protein DS909_00085 [Phaeobacter gallaeciensis]